jgi:uncharacterized membrane protein YgcG
MNEKLYEALEVCLNALETGANIEAVLNLYPQLADELRPLLEASIQARSLALPAVPETAKRRGRARVMGHAAEMRKSAPKRRRRWSMFAFPRLATSLAIALILLLSGTGLVSASNGALPGDSLYPVKRSWEDLRLFFIFSPEKREGLESEFEQERLDEISTLLTKGRKETIAFAGLVTAQSSQEWQISGITVMITPSSRLPANTVSAGAPVMVIGHTNAQGFVEVDTLETLGPGASLPPLEPSQMEVSDLEEQHEQGNATEVNNGNQQPEQLGNTTYDFQGVVESKNGNIWTINGQPVNVEFAENKSPVSTGVLVEFEGYYSVDGQFIATKIEVKSSGLFQKEPLNSSGKDIGNDKSSSGGNNGGGSNSGNDGGSSSDDGHDGGGDD